MYARVAHSWFVVKRHSTLGVGVRQIQFSVTHKNFYAHATKKTTAFTNNK